MYIFLLTNLKLNVTFMNETNNTKMQHSMYHMKRRTSNMSTSKHCTCKR